MPVSKIRPSELQVCVSRGDVYTHSVRKALTHSLPTLEDPLKFDYRHSQ